MDGGCFWHENLSGKRWRNNPAGAGNHPHMSGKSTSGPPLPKGRRGVSNTITAGDYRRRNQKEGIYFQSFNEGFTTNSSEGSGREASTGRRAYSVAKLSCLTTRAETTNNRNGGGEQTVTPTGAIGTNLLCNQKIYARPSISTSISACPRLATGGGKLDNTSYNKKRSSDSPVRRPPRRPPPSAS